MKLFQALYVIVSLYLEFRKGDAVDIQDQSFECEGEPCKSFYIPERENRLDLQSSKRRFPLNLNQFPGRGDGVPASRDPWTAQQWGGWSSMGKSKQIKSERRNSKWLRNRQKHRNKVKKIIKNIHRSDVKNRGDVLKKIDGIQSSINQITTLSKGRYSEVETGVPLSVKDVTLTWANVTAILGEKTADEINDLVKTTVKGIQELTENTIRSFGDFVRKSCTTVRKLKTENKNRAEKIRKEDIETMKTVAYHVEKTLTDASSYTYTRLQKIANLINTSLSYFEKLYNQMLVELGSRLQKLRAYIDFAIPKVVDLSQRVHVWFLKRTSRFQTKLGELAEKCKRSIDYMLNVAERKCEENEKNFEKETEKELRKIKNLTEKKLEDLLDTGSETLDSIKEKSFRELQRCKVSEAGDC